MDPTRLLFPALRWSDDTGYGHESDGVRAVLARGVGGFILFGGNARAAARTVAELQARSSHRLLFGADLERGAGQQFEGCTPLPPAAALGALGDLEASWRAGNLTAREARALGLGWIFAPVADLGNEPRNPIVGTRAFGARPRSVARAVAAWVEGCEAGGALACAKHFPGHGRTRVDSHTELPVVREDRAVLARDLTPFAAAVEAGVSSIMTAHVAFPTLDPEGLPATRSPAIVTELLRRRLGFGGLVVSDALIMEAALGRAGPSAATDAGGPTAATGGEGPRRAGEVAAALAALDAGVDVLLYPRDPLTLSDGLREAVAAGRLDTGRILRSVDRVSAAAERTCEPTGGWGGAQDHRWAVETAGRSLRWIRGPRESLQTAGRSLAIVDDDVGGPYPSPSRAPLTEGLRGMGVAGPAAAADGGPTWLAVFSDPRGWKGRAGLSADARRRVATRAPGAELVLLFGHPRLAEDVPGTSPLLCAWGGEAVMQEAALRELRRPGG